MSPEAIVAALEATSVEDAIRLAISLGGDADTQGAIAGSIAEARFGPVPREAWGQAATALTDDLTRAVEDFCATYALPDPAGDRPRSG